jgi:hypothetical protein
LCWQSGVSLQAGAPASSLVLAEGGQRVAGGLALLLALPLPLLQLLHV